MTTAQQVVAAFAELLAMKQTTPAYRYAQTGQGTGAATSDVGGHVGWAYVRYDDSAHRVSQVFNPRFPGIPEDVPVIIGKERPVDQYVQILSINWAVYFERLTAGSLAQYLVPQHGPTHSAVTGSDPAYMDLRNLLPGRVRQTDVATSSVYAEGLYYDYAGALAYFPGGDIDLAAYVPGVADTHRYVLVSIDPTTNDLAATGGGMFPTTIVPAPPTIPAGHVPLALVLAVQGMTVVEEADITDYRILFSGARAEMATVNEVALLAETVFLELDLLHHLVQGGLMQLLDVEERTDRELTTHIIPG
jgi:hypothetical protein